MIAANKNKDNVTAKPRRGSVHTVAWCALAGVAAACGVALFLMRESGGEEPVRTEGRQGLIAEATPAAAPEAKAPAIEVAAVEEKVELPPQRVGEMRDGFIKLPSGRLHRVRGVVTNAVSAATKSSYEIFDYHCENEIAGYLVSEPGQGLVGTPRYNGRFKRDFLESLKHPIVVTADDTPEDAALKRSVIQAKIELKDAMDRGEDIEQIMLDTRAELQDLARYKQELEQQMHEVVRSDGEMTTEEMEDLLAAANQMLEARGIAPMTFGPLTRRKLRLMREQELSR